MTAREVIMEGNEGYNFIDVVDNLSEQDIVDCMHEYAKIKCQELLKIVADKVSLEHFTPFSGWQKNSYIEENTRVDKESILKVVDLDEFIN